MKKIRNIIKNNYKLFVGIIIGGVLFGSIGVYAATIAASSVSYTSNGQSNVNGALNDLYTKANTWIDPSTIKTDSNGKIFASSKGIVIRRNGATHFIKANNWSVEKTHILQVFSDVGKTFNSSTGKGCDVNSSEVYCYGSDFDCNILSDGFVRCVNPSVQLYCYVYPDGSVFCN